MQRYFSQRKEENYLYLKEEDLYHIRVVMRKKEKDPIEVVYQNELYFCEIINPEKENKVKIISKEEENRENRELVLIIPLLQEQKMDYILQKATELGVTKFIPYYAERSVIKLNAKKEESKRERWSRICKEASEQSKRLDIPIITKVHTLEELSNLEGVSIVCSTTEKDKTLKNLLHSLSNCDKMNMIVGPEGGLSPREEDYLVKSGFERVTLGKRIMRVETVPLFLMSAITYEYME